MPASALWDGAALHCAAGSIASRASGRAANRPLGHIFERGGSSLSRALSWTASISALWQASQVRRWMRNASARSESSSPSTKAMRSSHGLVGSGIRLGDSTIPHMSDLASKIASPSLTNLSIFFPPSTGRTTRVTRCLCRLTERCDPGIATYRGSVLVLKFSETAVHRSAKPAPFSSSFNRSRARFSRVPIVPTGTFSSSAIAL